MYTFIIKIVRRGIRPDTSLPVIRLQARDHQEALDSAALLVGAWVETPLVVTADKYLIAHTVECQSLHLYGVTFDITIIVE
tara:strand:- start:15 stop:257 length:243 start_codon:yes stop_codon:yes gene_type:complete